MALGVEATFTATIGVGVVGLALAASLKRSGRRTVAAAVVERGGGVYEGRYTLPAEGLALPPEGEEWELSVALHGLVLGAMVIHVVEELVLRFASPYDRMVCSTTSPHRVARARTATRT